MFKSGDLVGHTVVSFLLTHCPGHLSFRHVETVCWYEFGRRHTWTTAMPCILETFCVSCIVTMFNKIWFNSAVCRCYPQLERVWYCPSIGTSCLQFAGQLHSCNSGNLMETQDSLRSYFFENHLTCFFSPYAKCGAWWGGRGACFEQVGRFRICKMCLRSSLWQYKTSCCCALGL